MTALVSGLVLASACRRNAAPEPTLNLDSLNVILIVVDTLGAKHLPAFSGKPGAATPNIERLASNGLLFERAYSASSWTKPSIASIFTSRFPSEHKVTSIAAKFDPSITPIAEYFKDHGYKTFGMVSHTLLAPKTTYSRSFDLYRMVKFKGKVQDSITSNQVTDQAIKWLDGLKDERSFLFLHYFDSHYNYQHHPDFDVTSGYKGPVTPGLGFRELRDMIPTFTKTDIDYVQGLYHEEIAYTDYHIGRLLDHLAKTGRDKNTLIVFVADHGEEFTEHGGIGHARSLYDELVHVPLIFYLPGAVKAGRVKEPVTTMDVLPTLMSLWSTPVHDDAWRGVSLKPLLDGSASAAPERDLCMEVDFRSSGIKSFKAGCLHGNDKAVYDKPSKEWELYDLAADPGEKKNLASTNGEAFKMMQEKVQSFLSKYQGNAPFEERDEEPDDDEIGTPEEVETLKTLGYL